MIRLWEVLITQLRSHLQEWDPLHSAGLRTGGRGWVVINQALLRVLPSETVVLIHGID